MRPTNTRPTAVRTTRWTSLAVALACAATGAAPRVAPAAENSPAPAAAAARTITVAGTGQAKAKPTQVEFSATVSAEAELASDAIVKHRDTKRRALKAIEGLKLPALATKSKGFSVSQATDPNAQQMMMRGQTPTNTKQQVQVSEQMDLVLKDADKLPDEELMNTVLKILDTARDAGLVVGPGGPKSYQQMMIMAQMGQSGGGLVTFTVPETAAAAVRAQAYQRGMDDAKAKAQRLAELAGAKLGRIVSVQDQGAAGSADGNPAAMMYRAMMNEMAKPEAGSELSSNVFGEIPLTVTLSVQFAIE